MIRCVFLSLFIFLYTLLSLAQDNNADIIYSHPIGPLDLLDNSNWLDDYFDDKINDSIQIVGLGEVSHGSVEPMKYVSKMTQYLIENKNFRFFLLEFSDIDLVPLRNYLLDNTRCDSVTIAKFVNSSKITPISKFNLISLFSWIKAFNLNKTNDLVSIAGFDLNDPRQTINYILNTYLIPFNFSSAQEYSQKINNSTVDNSFDIIKNWFKNNKKELSTKYAVDEIKWLEYTIYNTEGSIKNTHCKDNSVEKMIHRDTIMANNIFHLLNNEKTVLYAHNAHLERNKNFINGRQALMGAHLSDRYRNKYYVIVTDFSNQAIANVRDHDAFEVYVNKQYTSFSTTAAAELIKKFNVSNSIVNYNELIRLNILDRTNIIDAYGEFLYSPAYPNKFDDIVVFENISIN